MSRATKGSGPGPEPEPEGRMRRLTTVRYGSQRLRGLFTVEATDEVKAGDACLVRSPRGQELGVVLATPIDDGQGKSGCGEAACGSCATSQGVVLRRATAEEQKREKERTKQGVMPEIRFARQRAREYRLPLKIIGAEYLFDREKLILHFASDGRVEFNSLVKDLAAQFKTRIELKPIGARDEARLTGDVASCGRELCCRSFLHDLQPVAMRMAKQQKKTLDPTKIAGQCGKLKCCLRYEDQVYVDLQKSLPRRNSWVRVEAGVGKVVNVDLLLQKLVLQAENGERKIVHVSELLEQGLKPQWAAPPPPERREGDSRGPRRIEPARVPPGGGAPQGPAGGDAPRAPPPPPNPEEVGDLDDGPSDPSLEG
jgi:cell fate regulator YaaT (PSP1 superfamily)